LRKSFTITGVVLVLFGLYVLATITSLVQAYMAKPDAQNGGIVILSRFVRISYIAALIIAAVAGFLVLARILVMFLGNRKPTPVSTPVLA
jgi:RNase P/RNase MRP subunit POP5